MKDFILKLDKDRALRFGFRAMRMIKEKYKIEKLEELLKVEIEEIPGLVHAGLTRKDEDELSLEQVEDLLDDSIPDTYTMIEILTIVLSALAAHMGVEIDVKKQVADALDEVKEELAEKTEKKAPKRKIPSTRKRKKQH